MRRNTANGTEVNGGTSGGCVAAIGSNTSAIRAQRILAAAGITSSVKKTDRGRKAGGCTYGVSYPCLYGTSVELILKDAGIRVTEYRHDG